MPFSGPNSVLPVSSYTCGIDHSPYSHCKTKRHIGVEMGKYLCWCQGLFDLRKTLLTLCWPIPLDIFLQQVVERRTEISQAPDKLSIVVDHSQEWFQLCLVGGSFYGGPGGRAMWRCRCDGVDVTVSMWWCRCDGVNVTVSMWRCHKFLRPPLEWGPMGPHIVNIMGNLIYSLKLSDSAGWS